jgi:hypothetical protein
VLVSLIEQSVPLCLPLEPMKLGDIDRHPITERVGEFRNL